MRDGRTEDAEVSEMLAAWCGWGGGHWFVLFPLFWLVVIGGLFFLVRPRRWAHRHAGSGEAVLAERYARGEITEDEYRQRRSVLQERSR
jgi:putative membrane protein